MLRTGTGVAVLLTTVLGFASQVQGQVVPWRQDLNAARVEAAQTGRLVLVHFWATWCKPCKRLEQNVFGQPAVAAAIMASYIPVKVDADKNATLAKSFGIQGVPHDVILAPDGRLIESTVSPSTANSYIARMGQIAANYMAAVKQPPIAGQPPMHPPVATAPIVHPWAADPPGTNQPAGTPQAVTPPAITQQQPAQPAGGRALPVTRNINPAYADLVPQQPPQPAQPVNQTIAGSPRAADQDYQDTRSWNGPQPSAPLPSENQIVQNPVPYLDGAVRRPNYPSGPYPQASTGEQPSQQTTNPAVDRSVPPHNRVQTVSSQHLATGQPGAGVPGIQPTNTFPLGLDGYCPVTLRNSPYPADDSRRWVKGDPRWSAIHRGRTYLFSGQAERDFFLQATNADLYAPVLSGMDPVLALDQHQMVPGKRNHGVVYRGLMFLFSSEGTLQQFTRNADYYANHVRQVMRLDQPVALR